MSDDREVLVRDTPHGRFEMRVGNGKALEAQRLTQVSALRDRCGWGNVMYHASREGDVLLRVTDVGLASLAASSDDPVPYLRRLVDLVWQTAREDESVPSTEWADRMIAAAREAP